MPLILKPNCECCDRDLPNGDTDARICTFECTFCVRLRRATVRRRLSQLRRQPGPASHATGSIPTAIPAFRRTRYKTARTLRRRALTCLPAPRKSLGEKRKGETRCHRHAFRAVICCAPARRLDLPPLRPPSPRRQSSSGTQTDVLGRADLLRRREQAAGGHHQQVGRRQRRAHRSRDDQPERDGAESLGGDRVPAPCPTHWISASICCCC